MLRKFCLPASKTKIPKSHLFSFSNPITKSVSFDSESDLENIEIERTFTNQHRNSFNKHAALPKIKNNTGPKKPGANKNNNKSAKKIQRDKVLRQAQLFHAKKMKALLPDPKEVEKQEKEKARDSKMQAAVRDTLDDMMPSIVTEVSLKLGGAMNAQENAIKNIVDEYIKVNPVIETRSQKMTDEITNLVVQQLNARTAKMEQEIPNQVMMRVEEGCLNQLKSDMEQIENRIDTVRKGLNSANNCNDENRESIKNLDSKLDKFQTDLEVSCKEMRKSAEDTSKEYVDTNLNSVKEKFKEMKTTIKKNEKNSGENKKKLEAEIEKTQKLNEEMEKLSERIKKVESKCCTIL